MKHCISKKSLVCIIWCDVGEVQTELHAKVLNRILDYLLGFLFSEAQDISEEPHLRIWKFIEYRYRSYQVGYNDKCSIERAGLGGCTVDHNQAQECDLKPLVI